MMNTFKLALLSILAASLFTNVASSEEQVSADIVSYSLDNVMLFVCAVLVLFIQAGFATLEAGISPRNNTISVMFKNMVEVDQLECRSIPDSGHHHQDRSGGPPEGFA
jgi:hypothetical protein